MSPHSLLVAHVDTSEYDCFWLRLMDDRIQQQQNSTICADISTTSTSSRSYQGREQQEHILACSFVSDYTLATSHVYHHINDDYKATCRGSIIKLWDIRMVNNYRKNKESVTSTSSSSDEIILPSFPNDICTPMEPTSYISTSTTAAAAATAATITAAKTNNGNESSTIITKLSSTTTGTPGVLVASTATRSCDELGSSDSISYYNDHYVVDLGRLSCTGRIRQKNHYDNLSKRDYCGYPIHDIVPSHEFMICLENGAGSGGADDTYFNDSISIYNLHHQPPQPHHLKPSSRSRKRKKARKRNIEDGLARDDDHKYGKNNSWSYSLTPELNDRNGCQSLLTSLAVNDNGTAILGGSNDGGLYVWW